MVLLRLTSSSIEREEERSEEQGKVCHRVVQIERFLRLSAQMLGGPASAFAATEVAAATPGASAAATACPPAAAATTDSEWFR